MALTDGQLYGTPVTAGQHPAIDPRTISPKRFAAGSVTLAVGTPVAFNSSTNLWVVWASGGANDTGTIRGFVYADPIELDATDEVIGNVLIEGKLAYGAVVLPSGQLAADLKTSLRSGLRDRGLIIQGLDQVR